GVGVRSGIALRSGVARGPGVAGRSRLARVARRPLQPELHGIDLHLMARARLAHPQGSGPVLPRTEHHCVRLRGEADQERRCQQPSCHADPRAQLTRKDRQSVPKHSAIVFGSVEPVLLMTSPTFSWGMVDGSVSKLLTAEAFEGPKKPVQAMSVRFFVER